jgi:hypothetical protein
MLASIPLSSIIKVRYFEIKLFLNKKTKKRQQNKACNDKQMRRKRGREKMTKG